MAKQITEEQKQAAIAKAEKSLGHRQEAAKRERSNSFSAWGNDKCISRTMDSIRDMKNDRASSRQWSHWLHR